MSAPLSYVVRAPRSSDLIAWLRCNDVLPRDVPYPSQVFVETPDGEAWLISYEAYVRNEYGHIIYDPKSETFAYEVRSVALMIDPPMWWLSEAPPVPGRFGGAESAGAKIDEL